MPILREEPSMFPETLLEAPDPEGLERRWLVLYTKARQEKALARELRSFQIPFYLPLVKKIHHARGRKRTSFMPLFSGYVFLFAAEPERVRSLTTNRVSRVLAVEDAGQLLFDLRQLQQLIDSNAPLTIEQRLAPGHRVRVKQGALLGLEGTVLVRRGETRLLVRVNFLQKGASVEVDDYFLEKLD
ncbi:MAG: antitermination protein NusG [Pirellulales bacterium]|nr:antitermination protein NusG [Pirellulales bacterium]